MIILRFRSSLRKKWERRQPSARKTKLSPKFPFSSFVAISRRSNCLGFKSLSIHVELQLPCIRWLRSQYERRSKLSCRAKRHNNSLFLRSKQKKKTKFKLLWPLLILSSRTLGLFDEKQHIFSKKSTTLFLHSDTRRAMSCRTRVTNFWSQIKTLETQNASYFPL